MLKLFGDGKPIHPMADAREARKTLDAIPAGDPFKAIEELIHWFESVGAPEGFKPEHRAQLVQMIDEAAQVHLRKLQRDYLSTPRLSKFQENRLWSAIHGYWRQSALALAACIDLSISGQKGVDRLENGLPLLAMRALRALAAQVKWQYIRYGPCENSIWGIVARIFTLAENRKFARTRATVYPGVPGESSPEQEFLKVVMFPASSPNSLLPVEIELVDRLIAHFSASFSLTIEPQSDVAYWIDLAASQPPQRLGRPQQQVPTLRFFAAGKAMQELEQLIRVVKSTNALPSSVALGGVYEPEVVLDVLQHLSLYWSPTLPQRKAPRHKVKSGLSVTHGFDGVLSALDPSELDASGIESWIVENVSAGGFGAGVPQIKGEWLGIGSLIGLRPDGGDNWVIGVIRRFSRGTPQQGMVGIQTLARSALPMEIKVRSGTGSDTGIGILLDPSDDGAEVHVLLRPGVLASGQNLEIERSGKLFLLMPAGVAERGDDYEVIRCRQMIREVGE